MDEIIMTKKIPTSIMINNIIGLELNAVMKSKKKFSTLILSELILDKIKEQNIEDEALISFINKMIIDRLIDFFGVDIRYDVQSGMNLDNHSGDLEDFK